MHCTAMRPFWQPSEPERGGGQDGEPEPSAEPMQQAQEGAEADLGRGEVALQVGQEGQNVYKVVMPSFLYWIKFSYVIELEF